jgi:hypothetical protein
MYGGDTEAHKVHEAYEKNGKMQDGKQAECISHEEICIQIKNSV